MTVQRAQAKGAWVEAAMKRMPTGMKVGLLLVGGALQYALLNILYQWLWS